MSGWDWVGIGFEAGFEFPHTNQCCLLKTTIDAWQTNMEA